MKTEENNYLYTLEVEKERAEMRLKDQIQSLRRTLDNLEGKLDKGQTLYDSDGLQGNGNYIDVYLTKVTTYTRGIEQFKKHLENEKNEQ